MAGTRRAVVGCVAAFLAGALLPVGGCGEGTSEKAVGRPEADAGERPPAELTNSIGMKFRLIAPGTFMMGFEKGASDERPVHQVTITEPFYLGVYEVTQAQYEQVMGNNLSYFKGPKRPVERLSWEHAREFCRRLSEKDGVGYRLPTEAEWEYACRAGTATEWSFGDSPLGLGKCAWFEGNADGETHDVGLLEPNAWGLYDMHGNVWEWCQDRRRDYRPEAQTDPADIDPAELAPDGPQGPRVLRGGSWRYDENRCRASYRGWAAPRSGSSDRGFRVARSLP